MPSYHLAVEVTHSQNPLGCLADYCKGLLEQ